VGLENAFVVRQASLQSFNTIITSYLFVEQHGNRNFNNFFSHTFILTEILKSRINARGYSARI
jgi:hypothetical protein